MLREFTVYILYMYDVVVAERGEERGERGDAFFVWDEAFLPVLCTVLTRNNTGMVSLTLILTVDRV
jgi:hypothetical protein